MSDSLAVFETRRSQAAFDEARRQVQAFGEFPSETAPIKKESKQQAQDILDHKTAAPDDGGQAAFEANQAREQKLSQSIEQSKEQDQLPEMLRPTGNPLEEVLRIADAASAPGRARLARALGKTVTPEEEVNFTTDAFLKKVNFPSPSDINPDAPFSAAAKILSAAGGLGLAAVTDVTSAIPGGGGKNAAKAGVKAVKGAHAAKGTVQHSTAQAVTITSPKDLQKILPKKEGGQTYAILTEENPAKKKLLPDGSLEGLIQKSGYSYFPLQGMYKGVPEGRSFLVVGPVGDKELLAKAEAWGRAAGQAEIITNSGMKDLESGMTAPNTGGLTIGEEATKGDFYSILQTEAGEIPFSVHYDFDNRIPDTNTQELVGLSFSDRRFRRLPAGQLIDSREKLTFKNLPPMMHEVRMQAHSVYDAVEDMLGIAGDDEALKAHGYLAEKTGPIIRTIGDVNVDRITNKTGGNLVVYPEQLPQRIVAGLREGKFDAQARKDLSQVGASVLASPELTTARDTMQKFTKQQNLPGEGEWLVSTKSGLSLAAHQKGDAMYVDVIMVTPDMQGRGLGSDVVAEIEAEARKRGLNRVTGDALPSAVDFWKKQGFTVGEADEGVGLHPISKDLTALKKGETKTFHTRMGHTLKFTAADDLTDADLQMAIAYLTAPNDPAAREGWDKLIAKVEQQFEELAGKVNVEFVDGQPYANADEMFADIEQGTLKISKDFNEHPTFTGEQNLKFRAVHDMEGHSVPGNDFSMKGERGAFEAHAATLEDQSAKEALKVEVLGQAAASLAKNGKFPEQKIFKLSEQQEKLGLVEGAKADLYGQWKKQMESLLPEEGRGKISEDEYRQLFKESVAAFKTHLKKTKNQIPNVKEMLKLLTHPEGKKYSTWYVGAFDELRAHFGEDADLVAKFIAVLSPQNPVDRNVEWAFKAYRMHKLGHSPDEIAKGLADGMEAYAGNIRRIYSGEEFSGRKVQNFYRAILGDPEAVVIDGWMAKIWGYADGKVDENAYSFIEEQIRLLARETGDTPANIQANLWVSKKVIDGLKPNERVELLSETIARHGEFNKDLLPAGARLDEKGSASLGAIWFMAKVLSGGAIGATSGEDAESRIRNTLIGMGLGAVASKPLIAKAARLVRENLPPKFVKEVKPNAPPAPPKVMTPEEALKLQDEAAAQMARLEELRNRPKTVTVGNVTYELDMKALDSPDAVRAAVDEMSRIYRQQLDAGSLPLGSRGVIPNALAKRLAEHLGITEADVLARVRGSAGPVEHVFAYADVLDAAKQRVTSTHELYTAGHHALGDLLLRDVDAYMQVGSQLDGLLEETGRALQAAGTASVKALTGGFRNFQGPYELLAKGGTVTADSVAKLIDKIGLEATAQAGKAVERAGLWDMFAEVIYGFTLSNPRTNIVNSSSSTVLNPLITMLSRGIAEAMGGEVASGEARAMMFGYLNGMRRMFQAVADTYKDGGAIGLMRAFNNPPPVGNTAKRDSVNAGHAITGENVSALLPRPFQFNPNGWIGKTVDFTGSLIRIPSNMLELGDHLGYAVNFDMAASARAFREGVKQGKTGKDLELFIENELKNPAGSIRTEAKQFAEHEIFRSMIEGYPGKIVEGLGHPAMRPFITFVRTPVNIFKYNLEGVPVLNLMLKSVREDLAAGGARRDLAIAKMVVGSSVAAIGATLAAEGRITGRGPENPKLRQLWLIDHQPYSIRIGDKWYGYNYFDPVASWFGMVADAQHLMEFDKDDLTAGEASMALVLGFMRNFNNKTFAKDTFEFLNILTVQSGEKADTNIGAFERYLEGRARLTIPSVVKALEQVMDPAQREANGLIESWMAAVPGLSKLLPEKLDFFGEAIVRPAWNSFLPFPVKGDVDDPVVDEIIRLRAKVGMPPKVFDGEELTSQQYHDLVETRGKKALLGGKNLRDGLIALFESGYYKSEQTTDAARALAVEKLVEGYNQQALSMLSQKDTRFLKYRQAQERGEELLGKTIDIHIGQPQ